MFPFHLHRGSKQTQGPSSSQPTHVPPPRPAPPIQYKYYKYLINTIDKVKRATSWSCAVLHVFLFHPTLDWRGNDARIFFFQHPNRMKCYLKKKRKEKKLQRNSSRARKRCVCLSQRTFYVLPVFFYELQRMDWNPAKPSISQFHDCDKNEAKRGWILISIVNNKLENTEKFHRAPCHDFSCRLSLSPRDQLELFEFQHDSRLYKGISVHVCIYLFMCNLMGIVNMVRLLKLLFYLSGASCFSGFEYSVSSSCDFMVLRKQKFGVFFISLGYFNSALL